MAFHNIPPNGFPDLPDMEELEAVVKDVANLKTSVSGLSTDVSNLSDNKANQITIAPFFNAEASYSVGDLVYYNGLTYRCTNDHEGEWDADDFAATTVAGELDTLKSGLTDLSGDFTTHHTTLLSGVTYYKCGRLVFVTLSGVTLSNGTSLGVPGAGNNVVLTLRDESVGGISQVVMDTSGSIASGAGSTLFTDGHSYSGTVMYISAQ